MVSTEAMRKSIPGNATPLWRWMAGRRVTIEELAERIDVAPNHLGAIRRGERRPSDRLKIAIEKATTEIEREQGVAEPRGVPVLTWFEAEKSASPDAVSEKEA